MKEKYLLALLLLTLFSCQHPNKIRTLTITIDESLNSEPQWVYWFSLYGNEFNIIDSCFIEKGQTEIVLKDTTINDSIVLSELIFSQVLIPWDKSYLAIDKNDRDIRINNLTSEGLYMNGSTISGALAESEVHELLLKKRRVWKEIGRLKNTLWETSYDDSVRIKNIIDSISLFEDYFRKQLIINQFDSVKSTTSINDLFLYLSKETRSGKISKETTDSIVQILSQKYSDDVIIQALIRQYVHEEKLPPSSKRSEFWNSRRENIRYFAYNKDLYKQGDGDMAVGRKPSRPPGLYRVDADTTNVPVYKIGSKMGQLKLKDIQNNYHSIADIKTDYILIDFWAGWCIPCVQEVPNLIKVHDKYKSHLSIYAISLDNTQRDWRTAIEKSKSRQFIHVYAGTWANENVQLLTKSFGITSIPAIFLLDKNRKIIAINLNGDELDAKLSQLLFK